MRLLESSTFFLFLQGTLGMSAADWRSRSIYQVFTDRFARTDGSTTSPCNVADKQFCGGTWKGIESKLDYIKNMGFTAIWISPITEQIKEGYHGYYQKSLYNVNQNFGSEDDLKSLTSALHARGMWLMVDVVPNHMGASGCPDTVDYGQYGSLNDAKYYHSYCPVNNFDNQTEVEDCWIGGCSLALPDIKTEVPEVAQELNTWIKQLVSKYNIDGLRVDSAKHVNIDFLPPWCRAAGVFCMGEVADGKPNYTYPYQQYMDGILNYPLYHSIERVFQGQTNMSDLVVALAACTDNKDSGCKDAGLMGTFFENHDNPRFAHGSKDMSQVKNAMAFTIMNDGIPIIYQGQEQHYDGDDDPYCREALWLSGYNTDHTLYKHIALLNQIRNHMTSTRPTYLPYTTWILSYSASTISLRKDEIRTILTNSGTTGGSTTRVKTEKMGFTSGATVVDVMSCSKYTADGKGEVEVGVVDGAPVVLLPEGTLKGSALCGYS